MDDWVFADTCVWASFFTKPNSPEKLAIDRLLDADRIVLTGPIVAEVLLGFRRKDQADWIASRLKLAHYAETTWNDWRAAADRGRELASLGHRLPLSDLADCCSCRTAECFCLHDGSALRSPAGSETVPPVTEHFCRWCSRQGVV